MLLHLSSSTDNNSYVRENSKTPEWIPIERVSSIAMSSLPRNPSFDGTLKRDVSTSLDMTSFRVLAMPKYLRK